MTVRKKTRQVDKGDSGAADVPSRPPHQVPYEMTIVSAHRTPARMTEYAESAARRGLKVRQAILSAPSSDRHHRPPRPSAQRQVIIAGAGGAAHLPGMVAAMTPLPVIGVPVKTSTLSGVDSLYSIVQMPRGIPVATVAIGNAQNAGLLAARILGAFDYALQVRARGSAAAAAPVSCAEVLDVLSPSSLAQARLLAYKESSSQEVLAKAERLEQIGYKEYLDSTATREVK